MSSAERFVRHHKSQTDREISQAFVRLARDSCARAAFADVLQHVRSRAPGILRAPVVGDRHVGVDALINLARYVHLHRRAVTAWEGCQRSWRPAIGALAQHLLGRYPVPAFLAAAWYAPSWPFHERKRRWFIAHAGGAPFRSLDLPIDLTSRMEHVFLRSPDHFGIEYAMRRAELIGLGMPDRLAAAVLRTPLAHSLAHGAFWRSLWHLLIAHPDAVAPDQIGPLVTFLDTIRHHEVAVHTPSGSEMQEPPQPDFSLKGRTPRSLLRMMREWYEGVGDVSGGLSWPPSRLQPMTITVTRPDPAAPPLRYDFVELTDAGQLRAEGEALRHCVATYSQSCWRGEARIWSLRKTVETRARSIITIEVDPARDAIVQASGHRNRPPTRRARDLIARWAAREQLQLRF